MPASPQNKPFNEASSKLLPQAASGAFRSDGIACGLLPGLTRRQRSVCARHPGAIQYVIEGLNAAAQECQLQFADQRWNCTAPHAGFALPQLKIASRETAYVFALSSGAVSHALARACAQGSVPDCG
uniref:Protein Wnt n=1 Tax=Parascaris equorum TaxID=6256 RepID=A0A914S3M4_PAREQ